MKRRDFMKSGLISLASLGVSGASAPGSTDRMEEYAEGRKIILSNPYLDWELTMTGGSVRSTRLQNKLSGRTFELNESQEIQLTFSAAKARIEIPWWRAKVGPDADTDPPDRERGYLGGYHREDYAGEADWSNTLNLLLRGVDGSGIPRSLKDMPGSGSSLSCRFKLPGNSSPLAIRGKRGWFCCRSSSFVRALSGASCKY